MKKTLPRALLLLLGLLLILAPAAGPARAAESLQSRGNQEIPRGREVADVVVADGNLRIGGTVLGSVYVVAGDVLMDPGSRVQGSLTVIGGQAWVPAGASVGQGVYVLAGQLHLEEGAAVAGEVQVVERSASLTPAKVAVISRYILLPRAVPGPAFSLDQLKQLDLSKLRLHPGPVEKIAYLDLGRLGKTPFEFREVLDARELKSDRARIEVIKFVNPAAAEKFWEALRNLPEDRMSNSVHSSLGEGAHWYFQSSGRTYLLWTREQYLVAIQCGFFHDNHVSLDQERHPEATREALRPPEQRSAANPNGHAHEAGHAGHEEWRSWEDRTCDQARQALETLFQQSGKD